LGRFVDTAEILRAFGLRTPPPPRILARIERLSGVLRLEALCGGAGVTRSNADVTGQIRDVLRAADIRYRVAETGGTVNARQFPTEGPLIFYCNHPYGIADALIALELALARRPDTKVLANRTLRAFDINAERIIWVDPFSGAARNSVNQRGLREALKHLRAGGSLLMFPAGVCSHLQPLLGRITDPTWSRHLSRFIDSTAASAVPVYFSGRNSWTFQILGLIHPLLRTVMLLREFLGLAGHHIDVRVGRVLPRGQLACGGDVDGQTRHLRSLVYALADANAPGEATADDS
jgi:putative hemolysin